MNERAAVWGAFLLRFTETRKPDVYTPRGSRQDTGHSCGCSRFLSHPAAWGQGTGEGMEALVDGAEPVDMAGFQALTPGTGREATLTVQASWALASYFKKFSCEWQKQHATCLAGDTGTLLIPRKCAVAGLLVCPTPRAPPPPAYGWWASLGGGDLGINGPPVPHFAPAPVRLSGVGVGGAPYPSSSSTPGLPREEVKLGGSWVTPWHLLSDGGLPALRDF